MKLPMKWKNQGDSGDLYHITNKMPDLEIEFERLREAMGEYFEGC